MRKGFNRTELKQVMAIIKERHAAKLVKGEKTPASKQMLRDAEARRKLEYIMDLKREE